MRRLPPAGCLAQTLLFSESTATLAQFEAALQRQRGWSKGKQYVRIDGAEGKRQQLVEKFNGSAEMRLFLISTKAGSMGINLQSATRCIIYDQGWNPTANLQAVCRMYRQGLSICCLRRPHDGEGPDAVAWGVTGGGGLVQGVAACKGAGLSLVQSTAAACW